MAGLVRYHLHQGTARYRQAAAGLVPAAVIILWLLPDLHLTTWRPRESILGLNLLTHNFMQGFVPGSYPLGIEASRVVVEPVDFDPAHLVKLLDRVDYEALRSASVQLGATDLPEELPVTLNPKADVAILKKIHRLLFEIRIESGNLTCPKTGRKFAITNGVPNMLVDTIEEATKTVDEAEAD